MPSSRFASRLARNIQIWTRGIPTSLPNAHLIVAPDYQSMPVVAIGHNFVTRSARNGRRKKRDPAILLLTNVEQPNRLHLHGGPRKSMMGEVVIAGRALHSPSASRETRDVMGACPAAASRTAGDPSCCFLPGTSLPLFCIQMFGWMMDYLIRPPPRYPTGHPSHMMGTSLHGAAPCYISAFTYST